MHGPGGGRGVAAARSGWRRGKALWNKGIGVKRGGRGVAARHLWEERNGLFLRDRGLARGLHWGRARWRRWHGLRLGPGVSQPHCRGVGERAGSAGAVSADAAWGNSSVGARWPQESLGQLGGHEWKATKHRRSAWQVGQPAHRGVGGTRHGQQLGLRQGPTQRAEFPGLNETGAV